MEHERFDQLTKRVAAGATRRSILRTMVGGAAALLGTAIGRESTEAKPKGGPGDPCKVGCAGFNRQAKTACEKACKECGGNFDRVCTTEGPFGPTAFTCCATGTFCVGDGVCCPEGAEPCFDDQGNATCCPTGTFCNFDIGACEPIQLTTCPTGETAENCAAGVETSCDPDGFCALVDDVDNGCACIERACGEPCTSSDDCGGAPCVEAQGCCGGTFCAIPCGAGGDGSRTAGGWGH
jgi:hypothetical protein